MNTNQQIADLLFPNVNITVDEIIKKYPPRNLGENCLVTRFAPSPTGYIHIGGVYQCLINSYLAHQSNGIFYLRCEDTDKKREVEGAGNLIYPTLKKLGIKIDEGFEGYEKESGNYGPYLQSQRTLFYQAFAKDLVSRGLAYPCFCEDDDENADYRSEQKRLGVPIGYYGRWAKCRNLSYEQIKQNIEEGKSFKIRIKADGDGTKKINFHDELRGDISFFENQIDYVILKSDGTALYHLAHLVDDSLMHTSIVIRDESWLSSAPFHLQLFRYMNLTPPKYLHTAQIMTIDKETGAVRKISKRYDNWADSRWFLENGYPTEAIHEYLLNLINSNFELWRKANPNSEIGDFKLTVEKMSKSGGIFDLEKLNSVSKDVISKMNKEKLFELSYEWAKTYDEKLLGLIEISHEYYKDVLNIEREQPKPSKDYETYKDIYPKILFMYEKGFEEMAKNYDFKLIKDKAQILEIAKLYLQNFYDQNDDKQTWFAKLKQMCDQLGFASDMKAYKQNPENYKGNVADVSTVIRVLFTTKSCTPDLYQILKLLGKEQLGKRIKMFEENYEN